MELEISFWGYLYCTIMFFFTFYVTYRYKDDYKVNILPWLLILAYCLYSVWGDDYIGYYIEYTFSMDRKYRDIMYSYVKDLSQGSYLFFRFIVWGSALLLLYKTFRRLELEINASVFIFVISFMMTFSYARVSLAMAIFFYGVTYIIKPIPYNTLKSYIIGFCIIPLSYYGHRSMLPIIAMSPIVFINFDKKKFIILLTLIPVAIALITIVLQGFLTEDVQLSSDFEAFNDAANKIARIKNREFSLRSQILSMIHYLGIYIPYLYSMKLCCFDEEFECDFNIKGLLSICTVIIYAATCFFLSDTLGATDALGYRYLFMAYIPIIITMSYLYCNQYIDTKTLFKVMFMGILYESLTSISILKLF